MGLIDSQKSGAHLSVATCAKTFVALMLAFASVGTAQAATVTVSSSCTFAKAVGTINTRIDQMPCTHSGGFGSNDTVSVPAGTFQFDSVIDVRRSMTINGGGKWDTAVESTNPSLVAAIQISSPSIVVEIDNLTLSGAFGNTTTGITVYGANDTNLSDKNLTLNFVVVAGFNNSGLVNHGGRVLIQNTLIYLNTASFGGGVANSISQNNDGSTAVGLFVSKYSAISLNQASLEGGGVYNSGRIDLRSTLMQNNTAQFGAAIYGSASFTPNPSCNVSRDVPSARQSEFDDNIASTAYGIVSSTVPCFMNDSKGQGNSSPYCDSTTVNCPQH